MKASTNMANAIFGLVAALTACGTGSSDQHAGKGSTASSEAKASVGIQALDEQSILPVLFPGGRFDGTAYAWPVDQRGMNGGIPAVAIDTIIQFTQGGQEKAAIVISHYERGEDGIRMEARIFINSLSCAVLAKGTAGWDTTVVKRHLMEINSDPWFMMPKVEQAGKDNYILRVASVLDYPGLQEEAVDVAYLNVFDLERVLTTVIQEKATFLPSEQTWYDVEVQNPKGKKRRVFSEAKRVYE